MSVPILAYHHIQAEFGGCLPYTTLTQFRRQIAFLHDQGFRSISIADYVSGAELGPKNVIITFDDAYRSAYTDALPVLHQFGFVASIFVITKYVDDWNRWEDPSARFKVQHCSWEELRELAEEGWEIGSHTVTHPNLKTTSSTAAWHEVRYSKEVLEDRLKRRVKVISYPFGCFNDRTIALVKKAGYEAGCTLGYSAKGPGDQEYALSRHGVYFFEPFGLFRVKLQDNLLSSLDQVKQKLMAAAAQNALLRFVWTKQKFL